MARRGTTAVAPVEDLRHKAVLEAKLKELEEALHERDEIVIENQADPLDQVKSSAERELAVQRLDQQSRLMHEIDSALAKIVEHTYGICEQCDEPIAQKRLDVIPWARLCTPCQAQIEASVHPEEPFFKDAA